MTVHAMLRDTAESRPDAVALSHGDRRLDYAGLVERAARTAGLLADRGVRRGDRVALLAENGFAYAAGFFGILQAGACCVALNHANKPATHGVLLRDSGAVGLLAQGAQAGVLAAATADCPELRFAALLDGELPPETPAGPDLLPAAAIAYREPAPPVDGLGAGDLAAILYTSGSTGRPRGVTLSHGNLVANTEQILAYLRLGPDDSVCCVLPFHYSFGNSLLLTHVKCGGRVVVDNRFAFPVKVLETLAAERCTGFSGVPSHYAILCARTDFLKRPHPDLRYVTQAGGAMAPELARRLREGLPPRVDVHVMYGQTEASARLSWLPPDRLLDKLGSIGRAIPGVTLTVTGEDGRECATGEVGEIVARGDNIMQGYWNDPEATGAVLKDDGLHTGDLAYRDDEGFLFIVDRAKNIIKAGANRVSSKEVEETILELPGVVEACVIGVPDDLLGEAIEAWIVRRDADAPAEREILRHCDGRLAAFKIPRALHFVPALPKNSFGKVLKEELRRSAGS